MAHHPRVVSGSAAGPAEGAGEVPGRPTVVVAGPGVDLNAQVPRLLRAREGFALPAAPWSLAERRWACVGVIDSTAAAEAAITATLRGVSVVVRIDLPDDQLRIVLDDLSRVGTLVTTDRSRVEDALSPEQHRLLGLLAAGRTNLESAEVLGWSRRTLSRRLGHAREVLGARTTAEAVARWASLDTGAGPPAEACR